MLPLSSLQRTLRLPLFALALLACITTAQAEITRADLLKLPNAAPFTEARVRAWQPLVTKFGGKVFSEWERGLYEGEIGNHEQARKWLLKAADKGTTPQAQSWCLAYKLARGTGRENPDGLFRERKKSDVAIEQVRSWYASSVAKQEKKQKLTSEEKAAFAGVGSLSDDEKNTQPAQNRITTCRNLTGAPSPEKLFRTVFAAGAILPPYALNYLGTIAEQAGLFDEAVEWYDRATEADLVISETNKYRVMERLTSPGPSYGSWLRVFTGYRQGAYGGDGCAVILMGDVFERGLADAVEVDAAIKFYKWGIDLGEEEPGINEGMGYVFLAMYAQERLTEHYQAGRLKLETDDERKKYLSAGFLLKEAFRKDKVPKQLDVKP